MPPAQVKVCEYAMPTVAAKPPLGVTVMVGLLTVIVTVAGADVPPLLVAV